MSETETWRCMSHAALHKESSVTISNPQGADGPFTRSYLKSLKLWAFTGCAQCVIHTTQHKQRFWKYAMPDCWSRTISLLARQCVKASQWKVAREHGLFDHQVKKVAKDCGQGSGKCLRSDPAFIDCRTRIAAEFWSPGANLQKANTLCQSCILHGFDDRKKERKEGRKEGRKEREGKGREGKGREGKGREGKGGRKEGGREGGSEKE